MASRVIYTALVGEYETLSEQPLAAKSEIEFICFTDNRNLTSRTWKIVLIDPRFPRDNVRSARYLKVKGASELLSSYDETLWIDNRIQLKHDPDQLFDRFLHSNDIAMPIHSFRSTVKAEFEAVLKRGFDNPLRVREQLYDYTIQRAEVLELVPYWTAILFRRNTAVVAATMDYWMDDILRYSRRDQLSIRMAVWRTGVVVNAIEIDNRESEWHRWLARETVGRNEVAGSWNKSGFKPSIIERARDHWSGLQVKDRFKWTVKRIFARFK
jgi:hypothetical protein